MRNKREPARLVKSVSTISVRWINANHGNRIRLFQGRELERPLYDVLLLFYLISRDFCVGFDVSETILVSWSLWVGLCRHDGSSQRGGYVVVVVVTVR